MDSTFHLVIADEEGLVFAQGLGLFLPETVLFCNVMFVC